MMFSFVTIFLIFPCSCLVQGPSTMPSGAMALRPLRCVRPLKALSALGRAARPISVEAMQLNAPLKVTGSWVGFAERNMGNAWKIHEKLAKHS